MIEPLIGIAIGAIVILGVCNLAAALFNGDTLGTQANAVVVFAACAFVVLAVVAGCANRAPQWDAYKLTTCEPALVITDKGITYRDCGL